MAEPDDLLQPNVDRPVRPGEMYLSPEGFKYPNPQLLRRSGKVKASTKLPELQENLQYALDVMPMSKSGFGQGTRVILDPELPVLESSITPWFGRTDSPEYMDELRRARDDYSRAVSSLKGVSARHSREFERKVRSIDSMLSKFKVQGLGSTIKMGLASPNVVTSELDVRDAHMLMSYLMGRNLPPESATMDMTSGWGELYSRRHASRLGLQALQPQSPFPFGGSQAEHIRGLELAMGSAGQGNILAGLGLKMENDLPGLHFQEQIINKGRQLNPFTKRLVEMSMKDTQRVEQSQRALTKAVGNNVKFQEASVAYRNALEDYLDEIFNKPIQSDVPGLLAKSVGLDRTVIKSIVDNAYSASFEQDMEPFGTKHLKKTQQYLRQNIRERLADLEDPRSKHILVRLTDMQKGVDEYLREWVKKQTAFKTPRTESRSTIALRGGRKSVKNPVTGVMTEGVPERALNIKRIEQGTEEVMRVLGRSAPKIPMLLVSALAAGMVVSGLSRGVSDGEA